MEMLKMLNISKSFSGVQVLKNVNFSVNTGEVHALLGENGAGKSTLMNILAGVHERDSGTVEYDGKMLEHTTIKDSENVGIAFVHQELNLFNDLKAYENLFLRREITYRTGVLNKKEMLLRARALFESIEVDIDPNIMVSELETGKKQLLEIAKALFVNAKLFILDEPTTSLNNKEIEHLFSIIRKLKGDGKSFVFISHKMGEIFSISDRYTVLRNGEFIQTGNTSETSPEEVTKLMVGGSYFERSVYKERTLAEPVLELEGLSGKGFSDVTLSVRKGEVVGFTGLKGAGVSELMQTVFGASPILGGMLKVDGREMSEHSIHKAMRNKIAMIAANRKENSILPDFTLLENNYVAEHTLSAKKQVISNKNEISKYSSMKEMLNIKANSEKDSILSLSGGNQQKVILARWLNTEADIILMDNPTQGIDVGAKAEIYRLIQELAQKGKTILVNTLEIQEIQKVADRCVVFYHGGINAVLTRSEITEERVMLSATNAVGHNTKTEKEGEGIKHGA